MIRLMKAPIVAVAIMASWPAGLVAQTSMTIESISLPPVEEASWRFKKFPIIAFWGPPGSATPQDFENYRDAGFSLYMANPDSDFMRSLDLATSAGVPVLAYRKKQGFGNPKDFRDFPRVEDHPNIVGWGTYDEPKNVEEVYAAISAANDQMRKDPSRWAFFNALPPHVPGVPHHKIAEASARNGLPIISYDNYVVLENGETKEAEFFENLRLYNKWSLKYDVQFWAFALSIKHFDYRRPSESDLRWQQFCNLAYGAKGLWYFTYWGPTGWERWDNKAIVDPATGAKTELWGYAKAINDNVQGMGDVLLQLTNTDVTHTTSTPDGQETFTKGRFWISDVQAKAAIVSFFRHKDGSRYAMIVNKQHGKGQSAAELADDITLTFRPRVNRVTAVSWLDGEPGPLTLRDRKCTLKISGGTAVLLKLEESKKNR